MSKLLTEPMQQSGSDLVNSVRSRQAVIAILGMGHIGLPTGLGLAELGWKVIGADSDAVKVRALSSGKCPFYEEGLEDLLTKHLASGKFCLAEDIETAIREASILFVCVGTPQRESGEADLTQVEALARTIARNLNGYKLIVEKSTVPAITAQWIKKTVNRYARIAAGRNGEGPGNGMPSAAAQPAVEAGFSAHFDVASNPEFLQEGTALRDVFKPQRVVCGVDSETAREVLLELYRPLNCSIVVTNLSTAELIKHAANAFLATKVSFVNMVGDLCEAVGADVTQVAHGIGLDPRIGPEFLRAGIGFGGYCLPKDLKAFIHLADEHRVDFSLLKEVQKINQRRVDLFIRKIRQVLWVLPGKTLAVLGLAFKSGTDDIREAPSLKVIETLLEEGSILQLYDPEAMPNTRSLFPEQKGRLSYADSAYDAARDADALLILTEWDQFRNLDLHRLRDIMRVPIVVDGRNIYDPEQVRGAGFEYISIGR